MIALLLAAKLALDWRTGDASAAATTCNFKNATGTPCAFCGGTRATLCMAGGDFRQALQWNPLVVVTNAIFALWFIFRLGFGLGLKWNPPARAKTWIWTGISVLFAANWMYVIFALE